MKQKGLLKQFIVMVILVLITFFSINKNVKASSFAYNSFDWDVFYNENIDYWTDFCNSNSGSTSVNECLEITLSGKKKFYINLYKILAKYERKGYKLDDNIILATTFYYLTPDSFSDLPEEYLREYLDGTAYNTDNDIDSYDVDEDFSKEYFEGQADSIKMLTKHMFAYRAKCNGIIGKPQEDSNGKKYCSQGELDGDNCVETLETYHLNYTEYLIEKWGNIFAFFGYKSKYRKECESKDGIYVPSNGDKEINYDEYWEWLEQSEYFDDKVHLSNKYSNVLRLTNHKINKEITSSEKEKYQEEMLKIRKNIVREIRSILEDYDDYFADTPDSYIFAGSTANSSWWPIGSNEVTSENGISFADGNPYSNSITSYFGPRVHPTTFEYSQHTGIDIGGVVEGVTNIISVKDGTVVFPTDADETNCPSSSGTDSCNGGYGNYVVIQHSDGTYTLYAHLYAGSITVTAGEIVQKGQIIGKAGSSGNSTGPHLHFEVRIGSNSSASAVDPLNYISPDNPRPIGGSGSELLKMLHWFEGGCNAKKNGNNYVVIDDGVGIPTAGYGVALKYNIENFKKYGIDVTGLTFGSEIPIDIVDAVENTEIDFFRQYVDNYLAKSSITLTDYQVDCLIQVAYQWGDLGNFNEMYKLYGNSEMLKENTKDAQGGRYFAWNPSTGNGRAEATWKLFNQGVYTYGEGC